MMMAVTIVIAPFVNRLEAIDKKYTVDAKYVLSNCAPITIFGFANPIFPKEFLKRYFYEMQEPLYKLKKHFLVGC